jgi:epoxyqueuosine reductase QueG
VKNRIREFALGLGVEDVGFAAVEDYKSPLSTPIRDIFPNAKSIVVMALKELDNCESENQQIMMHGKMNTMAFARSCNYRVARFIQKECKARAMSIQNSYPIKVDSATGMAIGDVSLRHAAVAAGLGSFGRHNLVIHPKMGTRVSFNAILTDLELASDPAIDRLCNDCGFCADNCPGHALDEEGKTDFIKCIKVSQPYGFRSNFIFQNKFIDCNPEGQKKMLRDPQFFRLYQAPMIGFQYACFNCMIACPIGEEIG